MTKHRVTRRPKNHRGVRLLQLADGRQVARWSDPATGAQRQESLDRLGLTSQARRVEWAIAKAREVKAARLAWSLAGAGATPMSVDEAIEAYRVAKPVAANTASARKVPLDDFADYCRERGIRRLDAVTAPKLWPWRDQVVADKGLLESTRNLRLQVIGAFLRWAAQRDLVPLLPDAKVRALCERIAEPRKPIAFLRPAEVQAVLKAAIASDAEGIRQRREVSPFVLLLLLSGMRFAEAAGLDWREVDLEAGEIRLPPERCKGRRGRTITTTETPALAELLRALHRRAGEPVEGLVTPPLWHGQVWRNHEARIVKACGVKFGPHVLRRTCGTLLTCSPSIFGAASAFLSAKRLGHSLSVAEKHYVSALSGLPAARTLEAVAGIEDLCAQIVAAVGARNATPGDSAG